jgi:hypothetical protein
MLGTSTRAITTGIATAVAACIAAGGAAAAEHTIADIGLTSHKPGTPTGGTLHLVWPSAHPGGKPKPETKGVFQLPAGTKIDEGAVPACTASDTELKTLGGAACPPGSDVGPGRVSFITGVGAPLDPFLLDNEWYHGPGQIIGLFHPHGQSAPTLAVNRVRIEGASFVATPALPPGYPPGEKTAPKQSDQTIHKLVSGGRAFLTTPPTCPRSGRWISHSTVTYEDGSVETAASATPCERPAAKRKHHHKHRRHR